MLPFDTVAPSTPLFGVPRNMKEMKMCRWAVCSINCIRTSESGTLLPFSFSRSSRATLSAVSAVHSLVKASKITLKHQLTELQHESTTASLSCLRGYYSNMTPRTVKRAIDGVIFRDDFVCQGTNKNTTSWKHNSVKGKTKYASKMAWSKFYSRETSTYYKSHIHIIHINSTIVGL